MQETQRRGRTSEQAADACRRVAHLLGAETVAAVSDGTAPLEDVVGGRVDGLIVFPIGEAPAIDGGVPEQDVVMRAMDAVRSCIQQPGALFDDVLAAAGQALGVDELTFAHERSGRVHLVAWPRGADASTVPRGVRAGLRQLDRSAPMDEGVVYQLGVLAGMRSERLTGAFASVDRTELMLAGGDGAPDGSALSAIGYGVAIAHDTIEGRDRRIARDMDAERARWAEHIHDDLTQAVTASFLEIRRTRERVEDPELADAMDEIATQLRRALFDLRGTMFGLTQEHDQEATPDQRARDYVRGVAERWRIEVETTIDGSLDPVDPAAWQVFEQIVRESLANTAKHAAAARIEVSIRMHERELAIEVADDGKGFDPGSLATGPGHMGTTLLRERLAEADGSIEIVSSHGEGTRVCARVPITSSGSQGESR